MPKAKPLPDEDGNLAGYAITCPACGNWHCFNVPNEKADAFYKSKGKERPHWTFNGDLNKPTFAPSMLVWEPVKGPDGKYEDEKGHVRRKTICHSYVRDGKIQFLNDCAHEMRGQTVDLPDVDD